MKLRNKRNHCKQLNSYNDFSTRDGTSDIEAEEFQQLIAEVRPLNLIYSSQLSKYIVQNRLGYKYQHISGILEMRDEQDTWRFKGGISPRYFAKLCEALDLKKKCSTAIPEKFTSYANIPR